MSNSRDCLGKSPRTRAQKVMLERFPTGCRIEGRVGGYRGTVVGRRYHVNAQGGVLFVRWDHSGEVNKRVSPIAVKRIEEDR